MQRIANPSPGIPVHRFESCTLRHFKPPLSERTKAVFVSETGLALSFLAHQHFLRCYRYKTDVKSVLYLAILYSPPLQTAFVRKDEGGFCIGDRTSTQECRFAAVAFLGNKKWPYNCYTAILYEKTICLLHMIRMYILHQAAVRENLHQS